MTIAAVIAFCILLLILAFLAPRLSRHPERGGQKVLGFGSRGAGKAPGPLGRGEVFDRLRADEAPHIDDAVRWRTHLAT